jgi:hypothetical protein
VDSPLVVLSIQPADGVDQRRWDVIVVTTAFDLT